MNAKELREAAQRLIDDLKLWEAERRDVDVIDIANHILATVRDDDDESCNADWISEQTDYNIETHETRWVFVQVDERIGMFGDCSDAESWQVWCEEYFIGECVSRGQFRSLCRGLGIELKEGGK